METETKATFTQGEWFYKKESENTTNGLGINIYSTLQKHPLYFTAGEHEISEANAKIIVQAPKMLKALQRVKIMFEHRKKLTGDYGNENLYLEVINVIKNATE